MLIATTSLAIALRNINLSIWKDVLEQLKNLYARNIIKINEKGCFWLKLRYTLLECEKAKEFKLFTRLLEAHV